MQKSGCTRLGHGGNVDAEGEGTNHVTKRHLILQHNTRASTARADQDQGVLLNTPWMSSSALQMRKWFSKRVRWSSVGATLKLGCSGDFRGLVAAQ